MSHATFTDVLRHIRRLATGAEITGLEDRQLLEQFLNFHDEAAFEALLARHGPLVLGVCRRYLTDQADVEDAFQATFLVLLRKARSLRKRELVANWLYGVACRTALRAKTDAARRRFRERQIMPKSAYALDDGPVQRDLRALLDQEIGRLPAKLRLPILLCYLEGLTLAEAARQLGWPAGTVSGRLARARELLRARLTRRGAAVSAAGVSGALAESSQATVPTTLTAATLK